VKHVIVVVVVVVGFSFSHFSTCIYLVVGIVGRRLWKEIKE
jgi:uncharacterized membrane protein YuzA (DUF378 family)